MWIKSKNNEILILGESKEFQAKNLATNEQEKHPGEAQESDRHPLAQQQVVPAQTARVLARKLLYFQELIPNGVKVSDVTAKMQQFETSENVKAAAGSGASADVCAPFNRTQVLRPGLQEL